ncbi:hypothetical protein DUZ99_17645 [Xylanibacillus composti]|uniref:Spore germination lipase LipC n=1 Tax=Xylanibacillus composti TaxID=1572762 RepID=A0A8J4H0J5_9BACL|nr:GDSL-type esterase/lipase family protein [Xylanibacillus composti]MDT9726805.1 hypothetical protein [Xylanibacillus composti]GIQ67212.1 spore germination lipase LipC [Xylanibacillus composti]
MGESIHYLALGDSLTVGYGVHPWLGFVEQFRSLAESRLSAPVHAENHGVNGFKAMEILQSIKTDPSIQASLKEAQIITITAGGNDMLQAADQFVSQGDRNVLKQAVKACRTVFAEMFDVIQACKLSSAKPYLLRVADLYNPVPAFSESVFWVQMYNKMLRQFSLPNLVIADMYTSFLGQEHQLLSEDCIHPNANGYRTMAEQMAACGFGPLERGAGFNKGGR